MKNIFLKLLFAFGFVSFINAQTNYRTTKFSYDVMYRQTKNISWLNDTVQTEYNSNGTLKSSTQAGIKTTYSYNAFFQQIASTTDNIITDSVVMNFDNSITNESNTSVYKILRYTNKFLVSTEYYNAFDKKIQQASLNADSANVYTQMYYNAQGLITKQTLPYFISDIKKYVEYTYDSSNRKIKEKIFDNITQYEYNDKTRSVKIINPDNSYSTKIKDQYGNLFQVQDTSGTIEYEFDYAGNNTRTVVFKKTKDSVVVTNFFDDRQRKLKHIDPGTGTTEYSYDSLNRLVKETDQKKQSTLYTYNTTDQLTKKMIKDSANKDTIIYSYVYVTTAGINKGKLQKSKLLFNKNKDSTIQEYTYDNKGNTTSINERVLGASGDTVSFITSYTYDSKNNLNETKFSNNIVIQNIYNSLNILTSMKKGSQIIWTRGRENAAGMSLGDSLMNGIKRTYSFNDKNAFTQIEAKKGSTPLMSYTYSLNITNGNLDNRKNVKAGDVTEYFTYDNLNRLTQTQKSGSSNQGITYAINGNIKSKTGIGNYEYTLANKPYNLSAVLEYANTSNITYNLYNKADSIQNGIGNKATFAYLPSEERIRMKLSKTNGSDSLVKYYGMNYEVEIDKTKTGSGRTKTFLYVNSPEGLVAVICGKTIKYVYTDYMGSILAVSSDIGNNIKTYTYDAWGKPNDSVPEFKRGYTGHEHLEIFGLINMNARLYDPVLGRFDRYDNYIQAPTNSQNYNRYAYVLNNPLKYSDPDGNFIWIPIIIAIIKAAAVGAAIGGASYTASVAMSNGGFKNWDWGGFGKSVGIGALSGALTAGVGMGVSYLGGVTGMAGSTAGNIGLGLMRAGAHGIVQGGISTMQGGDFLSGFASGALGSVGGSLFKSYGGNFAKGFWGTTSFSALSGGIGSWASGGSFLKGAIAGATIGALNHGLNSLADGVENKLRNRGLNQRMANMMLQKKGMPYNMRSKGPDKFDCSGAVVGGINKTLGTNALDINNTNAQTLYDNFSTDVDDIEAGNLRFYDYPRSDRQIDHVTTILENNQMLHSVGPDGNKFFTNVNLNFIPQSYKGGTQIYNKGINWDVILGR